MPDSCFHRGPREWWFEPHSSTTGRGAILFFTGTFPSFSLGTGAGHHWLFEPNKNRPKEMSKEFQVRAKNMQVDSSEFDLQAAKEKQSEDCHDKNKTLLAHPEGNQQEIEKCRSNDGDATPDN